MLPLSIFGGLYDFDLSGIMWTIFIFIIVEAGFLAGLYLFITRKSAILGIIIMGVCGLYAFWSWG